MMLEEQLRRLSVSQRIAAVIALLLLPMAALSIASVVVLNDQEMAFRNSVEESIHTLLPLTTLEHYLEKALVDELEAQSDQSVPNFAALSVDIDRTFSRVESSGSGPNLSQRMVMSAQQAWRDARPSVQRLVERIKPLQLGNSIPEAHVQSDLQQAVQDVGIARQKLAHVVKARYEHAAVMRHSQLMWLIWSWVITLSVATALIGAFLHSVLGPIKALGQAAHRLGSGEAGVRAPVTGHDELTAVSLLFNEMAAQWETTHQTLLTEAAEDPLTGLLNRRGILTTLQAALTAHEHRQRPISIFMIDLDRFKAINDRFGHSAGDRALNWITAQMRENLRDGDFLGRYGGDEFLGILPGTNKDRAQQIARRMTKSIHEAAAKEATYPTISIGVASAPEAGWKASTLIDAADATLYDMKSKQRAVTLPINRNKTP